MSNNTKVSEHATARAIIKTAYKELERSAIENTGYELDVLIADEDYIDELIIDELRGAIKYIEEGLHKSYPPQGDYPPQASPAPCEPSEDEGEHKPELWPKHSGCISTERCQEHTFDYYDDATNHAHCSKCGEHVYMCEEAYYDHQEKEEREFRAMDGEELEVIPWSGSPLQQECEQLVNNPERDVYKPTLKDLQEAAMNAIPPEQWLAEHNVTLKQLQDEAKKQEQEEHFSSFKREQDAISKLINKEEPERVSEVSELIPDSVVCSILGACQRLSDGEIDEDLEERERFLYEETGNSEIKG